MHHRLTAARSDQHRKENSSPHAMLVPDTSAADLLLPSKRRNVAKAATSDRQSVLWERSCTWL